VGEQALHDVCVNDDEGSWSRTALRACLDYLPDSAAEGADVQVLDAWPDGPRAFCVIYRCPWSDGTVGLRVENNNPDAWGGAPEDPESFGQMVADFELGDPWYASTPPLTLAPDGVQWWGDIADGAPAKPNP
jgi:hypothetical protein